MIKANFRRKYVACLFIDLKKAFDTVDPVRLARKLKRVGISDNAMTLILSYLQNRETATTIGYNYSVFKRILVGVAQGSLMGPLHFITYLNDLLQLDFICRLILYADDAVLIFVDDSVDELQQMQRNLLILHK